MDVDVPFVSSRRTIRFLSHERQALSVERERGRSGIALQKSRLLVLAKILDVEPEHRTGDALAAAFVAGNRRSRADKRKGGEIGRDSGRVHAARRVDDGTEQLLDMPRSRIDLREVALGRNHEPAARPGRAAGRRRLAELPLPRAGRRHDVDPPAVHCGPDETRSACRPETRRGQLSRPLLVRAAEARPIEVHAEDPGSQPCEGDSLSVGRKRRGLRGIRALRELLETFARRRDPEDLLDPEPGWIGGEHDPLRLCRCRRPLRLSRRSGCRRQRDRDHDAITRQRTRPDRSVAPRTCGAAPHLATVPLVPSTIGSTKHHR